MAGKTGFNMPIGGLMSGLSGLATQATSNSKAGMARACAHLEREIKGRAPVDTGHLRGSYTFNVEESGNTVVGHVGTNVPYAIHQEFGTAHQPGTPHIRPALDASRDQLLQMMGQDTLGNI